MPSLVGIDRDGNLRLLLKGAPSADEFLVFLQQAQQVLATRTAGATN